MHVTCSHPLNPFYVQTNATKNNYYMQLYWNKDAKGEYWTINMYTLGHRGSPFKQDDVIYMRSDMAKKYLLHDCTGQLKYSFLDPAPHTWCPTADLTVF